MLSLSRPPVNALDQGMWDALLEAGLALHADDRYRAVVITGGKHHFAAGADIQQMIGLTPDQFGRRNRILQRAFHLIATAPQICVAAISGYALGGGFELALAADFRIGGPDAVLGLPEVTLGIMPGSGGTQRLPQVVGLTRAKDLILSGRHVEAQEALQMGLVDRIAPDPFETALDLALTFARGPLSLRHAKRAVQAGLDLPIEDGLALEAEAIEWCFSSRDGQEGLSSFLRNGPGQAAFGHD
ncbi:enoyl-CoA hydratase/isomerase family protein [Kineosporia mesophila]|uniref:Enoyl-CoA hydratase/isomerase family protein n=1 Tax=Kineosporia mesophila TaxID=566012 RepID=A0ABP6ZPD0_9ACTN